MFEILHLHIPKTAGSSLLELYQSHFDKKGVLSIKRNLFNENPETEKSKVIENLLKPCHKVLHGHFTYSELDPLLKDTSDIKIITFFRDPVDRVISNYFFFQKRILIGKVPKHQLIRKEESLIEYASLKESRNRMSKYLQGIKLEELFFFGFVEYFEEDIKKLFTSLGFKQPNVPSINRNLLFLEKRESVTPKEKQLIREMNADDVNLFEDALRIRNKKLNDIR